MFERMEIAEYINEVLVETSYKKPTRVDANRAGHSSQKREEATPLWTHTKKGDSASKHIERHVYSPEIK